MTLLGRLVHVLLWVVVILAVALVYLAFLPLLFHTPRERRRGIARAAPRTRAFLHCTEPPLLEPRHKDIGEWGAPRAEGLGPKIPRRRPSSTLIPFCRLELEEQLLWGDAIARVELGRQ